jgi:hypothetical protein
MGGVFATADISDSQLQGQAGGPVLQSVSMQTAVQTSKKPPRKLCENLQAGYGVGPVTVPLLLLICQQLDATLFHDVDPSVPAALKVIGGNFDMVMETLSQFLEFISANVPLAQYAAMLPSLEDLVRRYHIAPSIALFIAQPAVYHVRLLQLAGTDLADDVKKWDASGVRVSSRCRCVYRCALCSCV